MNFPGGIPEQKFNVNRACFPKEKHQNSQKWAKFMNFSFWPFLWFGLPGRLLRQKGLFAKGFRTSFQSDKLPKLVTKFLRIATKSLKL